MIMAEAMAMSASKRTLCFRRSILRMRFIATTSRSGLAALLFPVFAGHFAPAMTASNDGGNPILNNMGGRCLFNVLADASAKTRESHGFCAYSDNAGDQIFEQCDFMPCAPNNCKLTWGTGKFDGIKADLVITTAKRHGCLDC
jgi:hypothetical protein